jgi:hypothetical protein
LAYPEAESTHEGAEIPADVMAQRLPRAIIAALYRQAEVYRNKAARDALNALGIEPGLPPVRLHEFEADDADSSEALILEAASAELEEAATVREAGGLPADIVVADGVEVGPNWWRDVARDSPAVRSLVAFVALCSTHEKKTGRPCRIVASY